MLASDVINEARDLHASFDDNTHPDGVLLRALSRRQAELFALALERYPSFKDTVQTEDLPLDDFDAGIALNSPIFISGVTYTLQNEEQNLDIIPWEHRFDLNQPYYRGWIDSGVLYLAGPESIWTDISPIKVYYAQTPTALTAESDTMTLPDPARSALAYSLAEIMATRGTQRTDVPLADAAYFAAKAQTAAEVWLQSLWLLRSANARFIRDVGP